MFFSLLSYGSAKLGYPYKNLETKDFPGGAKVKTAFQCRSWDPICFEAEKTKT